MAKTLKEAIKNELAANANEENASDIGEKIKEMSKAEVIAKVMVNNAMKRGSTKDITVIAKISGDLNESNTIINNFTPLDKQLKDCEQD